MKTKVQSLLKNQINATLKESPTNQLSLRNNLFLTHKQDIINKRSVRKKTSAPNEIYRQLIHAIKNSQVTTNMNSTCITTFQILRFLLGEDYLDSCCINTDEALNNLLYKGKYTSMLQKTFYKQTELSNWDLSVFPSNTFIFNLKKLMILLTPIYKRTFPRRSLPTSYQEIIRDLVMYQIYGTDCVDYMLKSYSHSNKSLLYKSEAEIELINRMYQYYVMQNMIVIYGPPYKGKSSLAKLYLDKYACLYTEIVWLNASPAETLQKSINSIPFAYESIRIREPLPILCTKTSSTLLIIKKSELSKEDLDFVVEHFSEKDIRILILTETTIPEEYNSSFFMYSLTRLSNDTLKKILIGTYSSKENFPLTSEEEFQKLFKIVDYNALVLSILSKTLSHKSKPILRASLLDESNWLWPVKSLPKINCSYYGDDPGHDAKFYITRILNYFDFTTDQIPLLCELAIWTSSDSGCPDFLLKKSLTNYRSSYISYFIQNGLLTEYREHNIKYYQIPSLVAKCICYRYLGSSNNCILDLDTVFQNITTLINTYLLPASSLLIPQHKLHSIVYGLTMHLNPLICEENNRQKKGWKTHYNKWQKIIASFYAFMCYTGNINTAKLLREEFLYYYHPHLTRSEKKIPESWRILRSSRALKDYAYLLFANFPQEEIFDFEKLYEEYKIKLTLLYQDKTARISLILSTVDLFETILNIFFSRQIERKDYVIIRCNEENIYKMLQFFSHLNHQLPDPNADIVLVKSYFIMLWHYTQSMYSLQQNDMFSANENYSAAQELYNTIINCTSTPQTADILLKARIYSAFFELQIHLAISRHKNNTFFHATNVSGIQNKYKTICALYENKLWSYYTKYAFFTLKQSMIDFIPET